VRRWYNPPHMAPDQQAKPAPVAGLDLSWRAVLGAWKAVELDFHTVYRVDLRDGILDHRPWGWFVTRFVGLIALADSRLHKALLQPKEPPRGEAD
jgi:hypothetical protein